MSISLFEFYIMLSYSLSTHTPRAILTTLLSLLCTTAVAQSQGPFTITGSIAGADSGTVTLRYPSPSGNATSTAAMRNGRFRLSGTMSGAAAGNLIIPASGRYAGGDAIIFLEPSALTLTLKEKQQRPTVTGSHTHTAYEALQQQQDRIDSPLISLQRSLRQHRQDTVRNGAWQKREAEISHEMERLFAQKAEIDLEFVRTHPSSCLSPHLLAFYFEKRTVSLDSAEHYARQFTPSVQQSYPGTALLEAIEGRKKSRTGMPAPDFEMTDSRGNRFRLSDYRHKNVVLLDFWASWCVPCREITPKLLSLGGQYQQKGLHIVGVSWDFSKEAWEKAITKDSIGHWQQLYGLNPSSGDLLKRYSIPSIPMLILVGKDGIILGRYNGTKDWSELEKTLASAFR